jgi:hypothetical protein
VSPDSRSTPPPSTATARRMGGGLVRCASLTAVICWCRVRIACLGGQ